jgi:predicted PurR-regulated permease PerM
MKTSTLIIIGVSAVVVGVIGYMLYKGTFSSASKITNFLGNIVPSTTNRSANTANTPNGFASQVEQAAIAGLTSKAGIQALQTGAQSAANWFENL